MALRYERRFSQEEYEKISYGLIPGSMDDKWFIYLEDNTLYLHRSWTRLCMYQLTFDREGSEYVVTEALANNSRDQAPKFDEEYHVELIDFLISDLLLGESKPFPVFDEIRMGPVGAFQHHVAGTHVAEKPVDGEDSSS